MSELAIEARELRKEFGKKVAVADLSIDVPRGEVFGFLGPNGAGKTTSVKMLLGLTRPTAGTARILGKPLGDLKTRTRIGFLPEHFRFHEWLQAAEFLDLHGKLYGMNRSDRNVVIPDLLELVGLERRANTRLSAFSKGMLQRIGLAQALLNNPEVVILDEPTSGLDPLGRRLVRDIIKNLRAENITVFLNSHLLSEIELTCDRVAFIRQGSIVQVAALSELREESVQITIRVGQLTPEIIEGLSQFGTNAQLDDGNGQIQMALSDEEVIPKVASWLVNQGLEVYEISPLLLSFEDRFLQIVGDEMYDS
jgi:ABC-2 type transport system ATP-binding protein